MIPTSQIRDLRDAAERAIPGPYSVGIIEDTPGERYFAIGAQTMLFCRVPDIKHPSYNFEATAVYMKDADPTTVKALCTELLRLKGYFNIFQERLNKGCSHCRRDKETGFILNHCDSCCRKLTAGVCDVLDKLQADSLTGDEA